MEGEKQEYALDRSAVHHRATLEMTLIHDFYNSATASKLDRTAANDYDITDLLLFLNFHLKQQEFALPNSA